jgi:hypothetical protein
MKNIFILYVFDIIRLYVFNNMFDQTLSSLTLTKPRMQGKNCSPYRDTSITIWWALDNTVK